jgi:hypothetical protein
MLPIIIFQTELIVLLLIFVTFFIYSIYGLFIYRIIQLFPSRIFSIFGFKNIGKVVEKVEVLTNKKLFVASTKTDRRVFLWLSFLIIIFIVLIFCQLFLLPQWYLDSLLWSN